MKKLLKISLLLAYAFSEPPRASCFVLPVTFVGGNGIPLISARHTRSLRCFAAPSRGPLHALRYSKSDNADKEESGGSPESVDMTTLKFADGLKEHLSGIWGPTGGEDFSIYSQNVQFRDPLASYTGIDTYKKALRLLKDSKISNAVQFETHDVCIAAKGLVRARWTLSAACPLLPWTPRVLFTGVSIYTLDAVGKVVKHIDQWDSCTDDELPLIGGLRDIIFGGAGLWRAQPKKEYFMPPSKTLYRGKNYELRQLEDYRTVEMDYVTMPRSNKQAAMRTLNTYWAGSNAQGCALPPSQPTLVVVTEPTLQSPKAIVCFLPNDLGQGLQGNKAPPPAPTEDGRSLRFGRKNGRTFVVKRINNQLDPLDGWVSTEAVFSVRQELLRVLQQDGVQVPQGFSIARYAQVYGEVRESVTLECHI